jgi:hypothetical protein
MRTLFNVLKCWAYIYLSLLILVGIGCALAAIHPGLIVPAGLAWRLWNES